MKIGIVLKDRCHEDALKCEVKTERICDIPSNSMFLFAGKYAVALSEIKYIYIINE